MATVAKAAEVLGVSRSRVKQFSHEKRLRAKRDGHNYWSIDADGLRRFAKLKRRNGRPKNSAKSG